jgi:hypothetical protein
VIQILQWLEKQPGLALIGALVILAFILIPLALRLAGLSPAQIVAVIRATFDFFLELVGRHRNDDELP